MSHTLIVLPDDTAKPIVDAIDATAHALNIRMFLFTDPTLLDVVIAAHKRGVKVRVMLNPARRSGESENDEARKLLTGAGIEVRDSNPAFDLTHQKSMVVDNKIGFVESLNWEPKGLTQTRDYAIVTTRGHEVAEMVACFDADWEHKEFKPRPGSPLIWCPNDGRQRIAAFIDATEHTLWLQNERYQDQVIIERLVRAARRGVKVHILAKPPHSLKPDKLIEGVGGLRILQDVGVKVHTLKHLELHAKMLLADSKRAIIGSINLAPGSFDSRRELAIETDDPGAVQRLQKIVEHDWSKSHLLDLSAAALLADLKKREGLDPEKLVLYKDIEHWGYHHNGPHAKNQDKHGDKSHHQHKGKHGADKA
ncbi:MAG: phospholipase [Xanthomonadales bacterium]|nr:phospholipase [Xanthomonadales bacterium]